MKTAKWNGKLIASSDETVVVEGNHYFPRNSVIPEFLIESEKTTHCPWKGDASYYSLLVKGETNIDAAWFYPEPKEKAAGIKDHIAFWNGVEIS